LPPFSNSTIGYSDQANHQYDLSNFWTAAKSGNLPSVSFIKAPSYQQGHAGYSGPLLADICCKYHKQNTKTSAMESNCNNFNV